MIRFIARPFILLYYILAMGLGGFFRPFLIGAVVVAAVCVGLGVAIGKFL
jgi:uncharacterized membrane protein (DUF485 family)